MSYDRVTLTAMVVERLEARPRETLSVISQDFQVDRHTIDRALVAVTGLTFRAVKERVTNKSINAALGDGTIKSIKQAASEAGYSCGASLAKRTRRTLGMAPSSVRRLRRS